MEEPQATRYAETKRRPKRGTLVLIVLLHIAALYGLARVFSPGTVQSVERSVVEAFTVTVNTREMDPPPDDPAPDEGAAGAQGKKAKAKPVSAPDMPFPMPKKTRVPDVSSTGTENDSGGHETGDGPGRNGNGSGPGSGGEGNGSGNGIATKPSVRSGNLNEARDFPVPEGGRQTRFGKSVTVVFTVTTDGRAKNCSVASSQVDAETTAQVCPLVVQKIRFNPAKRADGTAVEARYGYRVDFRVRS
ncbi:MAG: energy transducer TonB [Sphingomonadaceae bacterium]|nr:energy transducer TonB [Sphingomonadaceae bacterium]MCP5390936.1 energy transducer TonB [Sphingomonadaceae bacterium]